MTQPQSTTAAPGGPNILRATTQQDEDDFGQQFFKLSAEKREPLEEIWDVAVDNYMMGAPHMWSGRFNPSEVLRQVDRERGGQALREHSVLRDTETHQVIASLTGQDVSLITGNGDPRYVESVAQGGPQSVDKARLVSKAIMSSLDDPGSYHSLHLCLNDTNIYGSSVMEVGYERRYRDQVVRNRRTGRSRVQRVKYVDRPMLSSLSIWDCYPDPSASRWDQQIGFGKTFRMTFAQARALSERGPNGERPVYNKADVERAIEKAKQRQESHGPESNDWVDFLRLYGYEQLPSQFGILEGREYWGLTPFKRRDNSADNRAITWLEGVHVRSHVNPFEDGDIPFAFFVKNPVQGRLWGFGPAEVIRFLQDASDNMLRQTNDAMDYALASVLLVGTGWGGNLDQLRHRRPRDVIEVMDAQQVGTVPVDYQAVQSGMAYYAALGQKMRSGTSTDAINTQAPDRESATAAAERVRLGTQNNDIQVRVIELETMPDIGRKIHSRIRQHIGPEGMVAMLGGEAFPFTLDDIDIEADVRFVGSRLSMSKFQKFQQLSTAAQTLGQNPMMLLAAPELVVRMLRDGLDMVDAEPVVAQWTQNMMGLVQQGLMGQQGGGGGSPVTNQDTGLNQPGGNVAREGIRVA